MTEKRTVLVTLLTPSPGAGSAEEIAIEFEDALAPPRFLEDPSPTRQGRWRLVEMDGSGPVYQLMPPNPHVNAP